MGVVRQGTPGRCTERCPTGVSARPGKGGGCLLDFQKQCRILGGRGVSLPLNSRQKKTGRKKKQHAQTSTRPRETAEATFVGRTPVRLAYSSKQAGPWHDGERAGREET